LSDLTCGEAAIGLLKAYGVDTVFGIPGVHTLEFYRGLERFGLRHITVRHEQGAAFMADGYARASGRPGVCLVISGPGVTNAATAIAESYADSIPTLTLSSVQSTGAMGLGRGELHELTSQQGALAPLTGFSATAYRPEQIPELVARAFTLFKAARPPISRFRWTYWPSPPISKSRRAACRPPPRPILSLSSRRRACWPTPSDR
jgi:thiamine pyrophosphate-dependent acetolactate synthase large subunit-like protein